MTTTPTPLHPVATTQAGMSDVSKDRKAWKEVHAVATQRLKPFGGGIVWSGNQHEVMRWIHDELTLIFYPHKTTAGNHHIRVRAGRCKNRLLLADCVMALAENSCNFQFPTEPKFHEEGVRRAVAENRPMTN